MNKGRGSQGEGKQRREAKRKPREAI